MLATRSASITSHWLIVCGYTGASVSLAEISHPHILLTRLGKFATCSRELVAGGVQFPSEFTQPIPSHLLPFSKNLSQNLDGFTGSLLVSTRCSLWIKWDLPSLKVVQQKRVRGCYKNVGWKEYGLILFAHIHFDFSATKLKKKIALRWLFIKNRDELNCWYFGELERIDQSWQPLRAWNQYCSDICPTNWKKNSFC